MDAELELEEPTELGGDTSSSEDGDRDIIVTLLEHHEPVAMSVHDG